MLGYDQVSEKFHGPMLANWDEIDQKRLILLEEGHCLRDQALEYCATALQKAPLSLGATSLATVMQMVANGYGVTLVPRVALDVEVRDARVKLLRFARPVSVKRSPVSGSMRSP